MVDRDDLWIVVANFQCLARGLAIIIIAVYGETRAGHLTSQRHRMIYMDRRRWSVRSFAHFVLKDHHLGASRVMN